MKSFDWHADSVTTATPVKDDYKSTQNVRRFMCVQFGKDFRFNRSFIKWIKNGASKTMGDVALKWKRRREAK